MSKVIGASKGIAVFDFDGTLTSTDSFLAFIRFIHGWKGLLWGVFLHLPAVLSYLIGRLRNDDFKRLLFLYFFGNIPATVLEEKGRQFSLRWIPKALLQGAKDRLDWHQSQEHEIIILSASSDLWLEAWCQEKGYELIATKFAKDGHFYKGEYDGKNCYGEEKERRILSHLSAYPVAIRYGYGDRKSDQAYLRHCGHANHLPLLSGLSPFLFRTNQLWSPLLFRLLKLLFFLLFASLPVSLSIDFSSGIHQINLPSEPILGLLTILSLAWFLVHRRWPKSHYQTPIGFTGLLFMAVMLLTSLSSSMYWVSFKYVLIAGIHWWVFFHLIQMLFDYSPNRLTQLFHNFLFGFLAVLGYTWFQHSQLNFRIDASVLAARPFYFDHALYSCCTLLLLGFVWPSTILFKSRIQRSLFCVFGLLLLIGLYLSFSRAAWLSAVIAGVGTLTVWKFKMSLQQLISITIVCVGIVFLLMWRIPAGEIGSQNNASTAKNPLEHLQSVLNTSNNVSNLERRNRYSCAWRMFKDRPLLGFGPGTYERQYLAYQRKEDMTRISVTEFARHRPGKGGGAHSEYLQALAESGILGFASWVFLVLAFLFAVTKIASTGSSWNALLALGLFFGLSTFFLHGIFNNFLHHDKIAALVWGGLAVLHTLYQRNKMEGYMA